MRSNVNISVAMATYNGAPYIEAQITSILTQTVLPNEIVISDDGSSDNTIEIINTIATTSKVPIRLIQNTDVLGVTGNFMRAIRKCSGDYIALSDQDDVWLPTKLAVLQQHVLDMPSTQLVISNAHIVDESLTLLGMTLWDQLKFSKKAQIQFSENEQLGPLLRKNLSWGLTLFVSKALIQDEHHDELIDLWKFDGWLGIKASLTSNIKIEPQPLTYYRQHGSNDIGQPRLTYNLRNIISDSFNYEAFQNHLKRCECLLTYIQHMDGVLSAKNEVILHRYIKALKRRIMLPKNRWGRVLFVLKHFFSGDYHILSYSSPFLSALKDVLLSRNTSK